MRRLFVGTLLVGLCAAFGSTSLAQSRSNRHIGINAREQRQKERIEQGIRSGELTRRETARLFAEQAAIRADEARARRSGGELTWRERLRLERELDRASRDIYRQKHDDQDRH
ncbi:hypothetical protein [Pyrinomonas methylaliphatogenes]|mgnify:CR=1 FL=1|jgi:hypothetical protein|uniref:Uncharacterized protein n=1 Tax=Pyrinomonas methylaliphatogenes TaxID=454194 RepID=A0A0B6X0J4_9BACT|nr:hypothetical protein [Pyrinomonas methylaliphatogenes]MBX5477474.1 hypothetical protein [Pyrinomonas methylaliphatogenes]CDM66861.1 hypothetical protein PYK22_02900 [Pyrinomonas methylaliphatogenes]